MLNNNIPTLPYINPSLSYGKALLANLNSDYLEVEVKGSNWYCDPAVVTGDQIFGPSTTTFVGGATVVDTTFVKGIQNSMFFRLEDEDVDQSKVINRNYSVSIGGSNILVDKELVSQHSSVLKELLDSNSTVEEVKVEYLQQVLTFIHEGKLGVDSANFTSQDDSKLINLKQLIELIQIADKYQVEKLLVEISKVVNDLIAMIIIEKCKTISNKGKKIIFEKCYEFIGHNPASVIAYKVYDDQPTGSNFMQDIMVKFSSFTAGQHKEEELFDMVLQDMGYDIDQSNNKKEFSRLIPILKSDPFVIAFSELDVETLTGIVNSKFVSMNEDSLLVMLSAWYLADTSRLEDACQIILSNDWNQCTNETLTILFHNIFVHAAKKRENVDLWEKLCDKLSQTIFKHEGAMGKEWNIYNENRPERRDYNLGSGDLRVLFVGLDASGKTFILYRLKLGENITTIPTIGFNVETLTVSGKTLTIWDIGGQQKIRPLWRHYYTNTAIVVFIVDANDRERFDEACDNLQRLAAEDDLRDCSILVLVNKLDLPNAASINEVVEKLELKRLRNPNWMVQGCSALQNVGLDEGMKLIVKAHSYKKLDSKVLEEEATQEKPPVITKHFGKFDPKNNYY